MNRSDGEPAGKQSVLSLNEALVDWWTITTYEEQVYKFWRKMMVETERKRSVKRIMQYVGESVEWGGGVLEVTIGRQKGSHHYMMRCSGILSNTLFPYVGNQISDGTINVSRIDLQYTIKEPSSCNMVSLFSAMEKRKSASYISSKSGFHGRKLATVGIGKRTSERYIRVYQKEDADNNGLLRFEVEFKGRRAYEVARKIAMPDAKEVERHAVMRYEVQNTKSTWLDIHFGQLSDVKPNRIRIQVKTSWHKTADWLIGILPTLNRIVNADEADGTVYRAYANELKSISEKWNGCND